MKKRKVLSTALTLSLGLGLFNVAAAPPNVKAVEQGNKFGATADLALANDERLIEMLKREGKLAKNASPAEAEKALKTYLKAKSQTTETKDKLPKALANIKENDNATSNGLKNGNGNKLGQANKNTVDSVNKEEYDGAVRKDKVLVLAIDFPDYRTGSITKEETDMWYENYPKEHFQDMVFGDNGYIGPDGKTYVSMKQYYEQQSGGSYSVEGEIAGWYTADNPAKYYGENFPAPDGNDSRPRTLVREALAKAAKDPNINLAEYDVWDRDDYDGDGVYAEPDGIIDHLMVIHAGVGEEAGGGALGGDAIWSHRSKLSTGPIVVPSATSTSDRYLKDGVNQLAAWDYTIEPEDGAAGVFTHEFGHDLGLPDEYDTIYSGAGEPVEYWSLMSSGSWTGSIPGTEPPGISPYSKQMLQDLHGGNWLSGTTLDSTEIDKNGTTVLLDEAVTKGTNNDAVRVDLPDKETFVNTPASGKYEYYGGKGDELDNSMSTTVDLTNAEIAELNFKTWYDIETDWDYASVQVKEVGSATWTTVQGNITTNTNPFNQNPGHGITGSSSGWVDASFDLSAYAGKNIELKFNYWTDVAVSLTGFYVDDIAITVDGNQVLTDNADVASSNFELDGFTKDEGKFFSNRYYLLEWRTHNGVDIGLKNIRRGASLMSYDKGLVVWYVDESYGDDNWTGIHPGEGFLGVVDADQHTNYWSDKAVASTRYQMHDAAFSLNKSEKMFLNYPGLFTMTDNFTQRNPLFDDSANYSNSGLVDAGRNVPKYGLKFRVVGESADGSVGKVLIFK
jgi:immune inhibitor A